MAINWKHHVMVKFLAVSSEAKGKKKKLKFFFAIFFSKEKTSYPRRFYQDEHFFLWDQLSETNRLIAGLRKNYF